MKLNAKELKELKVPTWEQKPTMLNKDFLYLISNLRDDNYLTFRYDWDEYGYQYSHIKDVIVTDKITEKILFARVQGTNPNLLTKLCVLKAPFDTRNAAFFNLLKYLIISKADNERDGKSNWNLFIKLVLSKEPKQIIDTTKFENSFLIHGREDTLTALNTLCFADTMVINETVQVCDVLESYFNQTIKKSFYGGNLHKIVTAIKNPYGGLIKEFGGEINYFYIGEKSELIQSDEKELSSLAEAKTLYRNRVPAEQIYIQTKWQFNKQDFKWRRRISDKEVRFTFTNNIEQFICPTEMSNAKQWTIRKAMTNGDFDDPTHDERILRNAVKEGWSITLGDLLYHPTLYTHYPSLYKMPIFFSTVMDTANDTYYFSPTNKYIVINGNRSENNLLAILMHEVQHAIQDIEGWSRGGNPFFAGLIHSIGAEKYRAYLYQQKVTETIWKKYLSSTAKFDSVRILICEFEEPLGKNMEEYLNDEETYLSSIEKIIDTIVVKIAYSKSTPNELLNKLNNISPLLVSPILISADIYKEMITANEKYAKLGYKDDEIERLSFIYYEGFAGEVESRDTQNSYKMDEFEEDYIYPSSLEGLYEPTKNAVFSAVDELSAPKKVVGGCETKDGKSIIHLTQQVSPEPFLHEVGHILYDVLPQNDKELIENLFAQDAVTLKLAGIVNHKEMFVELWLQYLSKINYFPLVSDVISQTRLDVFMPFEIGKLFDNVFADAPKTEKDTFDKYTQFMKELKTIVHELS